ncbi:longitudinals lacking protein, isoforms F/I/K/T-like [Copidosoma floridanum]|uniref:longitudinals lacking protein, isoforms F/I/K/T-like n=1 Tax=Copidosoma floridanum TaxID=29053 RepID=UPI0006C95D3C|nr:longitudinals lacking protein, isoforms F/I/K/T-like [Copidosoma floridanum]
MGNETSFTNQSTPPGNSTIDPVSLQSHAKGRFGGSVSTAVTRQPQSLRLLRSGFTYTECGLAPILPTPKLLFYPKNRAYLAREYSCEHCDYRGPDPLFLFAGKSSRLSMISLLRRNFKQFGKKPRPLTRSRSDQRQRIHLQGRSELEIERIDEDDVSSESRDSLVFPASLGLVSRQYLEQQQLLQRQHQQQLQQDQEQQQKQEPSQSREFRCRFCGKGYRWKSTMRRHEVLECGNKPPSFQCPQCPYKARQRGNLTVHFKRHHQPE